MRIWHEDLISKLCRQHLLAMWREGLGCYKIITEGKTGYRNHPQVKEFEYYLPRLFERLTLVRKEILKRGYNPKPMPKLHLFPAIHVKDYKPDDNIAPNIDGYKPWQTLEQQIEILKKKGCECKV